MLEGAELREVDRGQRVARCVERAEVDAQLDARQAAQAHAGAVEIGDQGGLGGRERPVAVGVVGGKDRDEARVGEVLRVEGAFPPRPGAAVHKECDGQGAGDQNEGDGGERGVARRVAPGFDRGLDLCLEPPGLAHAAGGAAERGDLGVEGDAAPGAPRPAGSALCTT